MKSLAYHDPYDLCFREPFGAVVCGGRIVLRLLVSADGAAPTLRVWDGRERVLEPFRADEAGAFFKARGKAHAGADGCTIYSFELNAGDEPGLLWYDFRLDTTRGRYYVGAEDDTLRGGCVCGHGLPHDYRVTVYKSGFRTPDWFKGCTAYQIFPDRFYNSGSVSPEAAEYHRLRGRRVFIKNWEEPVDYLPRGGARFYSPSDFYMGDLKGIIEKIPYLKSLNVEALYLNPIFESPYNHRYSISDYMKIDPLLGTEEDFALLCAELKKHGIRVILDGVFSHTGDDSVYFDRYGTYGGGAYNDPSSPFRDWYIFNKKYKCGYRSWWGFDTLPEVDELQPSYMEFIAGVLEKWIRLGASGWRLDVADELPNGFMEFLRRTVKAIDPEAVLLGEVWEDAAVKKGDFDGRGTVKRRGYTDGDMLDGVMDYPFADAVCDFLSGDTDAYALKAALLSQLCGYPDEFMRAQLGMLGSHDTYRVLSRLSGAPPKDTLSREAQAVWRPSEDMAARGKSRLMQAAVLQFAMPFAPCIYYGDEAGLTGLSDPFCRKPYPWGFEDDSLLNFYRELTRVRAAGAALKKGGTAFAAPDGETFAVYRSLGPEAALAAVSRTAHRVTLREGDFYGSSLPRFDGASAEVSLASPAGQAAAAVENGAVVLDMPADSAAIVRLTKR